MNILALEFSAAERSVAIGRIDDKNVTVLSSIRETDYRGLTGMTLVDRALQEARLRPPEIALIAVGLGPGSYTGIRSALAIAQGWQLGRGVEAIGIASDLVLAETARARGQQGEITIIIDAQRGDVYTARFSCDAQGCRSLAPLTMVPANQLPVQSPVIGPEASKFTPGATDLAPSAEILARLAPQIGNRIPAETLEPIYLRETTFVKAAPPRHVSSSTL